MRNSDPVFIVGSSRSGTTLFRDLLRQDARNLCPEETHFFRWNEPFASTYYVDLVLNNETLIQHRTLDGVSQEEFSKLLAHSRSRQELFNNYMDFLRRSRGLEEDVIYIDKTPQHVYALNLIHSTFPNLKVIHLVRNPLNVISSLIQGRQFEEQSLDGALNFWLEAVALVRQFTEANASQIVEIKYEMLVREPQRELNIVNDFLGVKHFWEYDFSDIRLEKDRFLDVLSEDQIDYVRDRISALGFDHYLAKGAA